MDLEKTGLILEGGGHRGVYTSGVLRYFMEKKLYFPYVIGVSMGACNAVNYIARQTERNRTVNIKYVNDARYFSYSNYFTRGEIFGMDFIFDQIPKELEYFDFETFKKAQEKLYIGVTDCVTGEAVYYEKNAMAGDMLTILKASASLPFFSKPVTYDNRVIMDGGISDSIPLEKSLADGNIKNVLVLTQPRNYRKKAQAFTGLIKFRYPEFRGLNESLLTRHVRYNEIIEKINNLEEAGKIFVIRPKNKLKVKRIERNKSKLYEVYEQGYIEAEACYNSLCSYFINNEIEFKP